MSVGWRRSAVGLALEATGQLQIVTLVFADVKTARNDARCRGAKMRKAAGLRFAEDLPQHSYRLAFAW